MGNSIQKRQYLETEAGFYGRLFLPEDVHMGIIVISDELTGCPNAEKLAGRLAEEGYASLAVQLWGRHCQSRLPDRISANRLEAATRVLRVIPGVKKICVYGVALGSLYAAVAAEHIEDIGACVMIAPVWSAFEGLTAQDRMSGHSCIKWNGLELPYVRVNLTGSDRIKRTEVMSRISMEFAGNWNDPGIAKATDLHPENIVNQGKSLLMMAGGSDCWWPSGQVVAAYSKRLQKHAVSGQFTERIYPRLGHAIGVMPDRHPGMLFWNRFSQSQNKVNGRLWQMEMKESELTALQWLQNVASGPV